MVSSINLFSAKDVSGRRPKIYHSESRNFQPELTKEQEALTLVKGGFKSKARDNRTTYGETVAYHVDQSQEIGENIKSWASPEAKWRKKWDVLQAIVLLYIAVVVPLRVGFDIQTTGPVYVLDLVLDLYFWTDIVLNFFFAYENSEGVIVNDRRAICVNYLKGWFLLDVSASLPIDMVMRIVNDEFMCSVKDTCGELSADSGEQSTRMIRLIKLIRILRLMKMLRLMRMQRILDRYQDELFTIISYINIIKLNLILIGLGHIFGCFFYFFSTEDWRSEREKTNMPSGSWIEANNIAKNSGASLSEKYSVASYWAFTTMTTVGYGDISAGTMAERFMAILGMLVGGFVFSGLIGAMTKLINTRDLSKQAYKDKMDVVGAFVRDSKLPAELRLRVLRFFRRQEVHAYDEHEFMQQLPFKERTDMLWFNYGVLIMSVPVFRTANRLFLGEIMNSLEPMNLQPGQMVLMKGEAATHMFLIAKGLVELLCDDGETVYRILHGGSYFGEEAIFADDNANALAADADGVRAGGSSSLSRLGLASEGAAVAESVRVGQEGNVKLLRLQRREMHDALERHPEVLTKMRDEHLKRKDAFRRAKHKAQGSIENFSPLAMCDEAMKASPYYHRAVQEAQLRALATNIPAKTLDKLLKKESEKSFKMLIAMQAADGDIKMTEDQIKALQKPNKKTSISTPTKPKPVKAGNTIHSETVSPTRQLGNMADGAEKLETQAEASPGLSKPKLPPIKKLDGSMKSNNQRRELQLTDQSLQDLVTALSGTLASAVSEQVKLQMQEQRQEQSQKMQQLQERLGALETTVAAKIDQLSLSVAGAGKELEL